MKCFTAAATVLEAAVEWSFEIWVPAVWRRCPAMQLTQCVAVGKL